MKKILVTGASGFIGQHLVERLRHEGCSLRLLVHHHAPSRSDIETIQGDLTDAATIQGAIAGCDTIFHLAGKAHALDEVNGDNLSYRSINIEGTRNLLEEAVVGGVRRFVFFSSVKSMGEETEDQIDESLPPQPLTAYGRSKWEAESLVLDYGRRFGFHAVCLRLPLVYGEGNKGNLTRMVAAIDRGFFPPLGELKSRRSMVHVSNVIQAALLAANQSQANGKCYIVTDGEAYTTTELYRIILQSLGKKIPQWHVPFWVLKTLGWLGDGIGRARGRRFLFDSDALKKMTGSAWYSSKKISNDLGYQPLITFQQALPEIINWYRGLP